MVLLKADLIGQPEILEILEHPADFIESSEFLAGSDSLQTAGTADEEYPLYAV